MSVNSMQILASSRRQRGFTLIEVMIALIVMGIGLLGIAKLMLYSTHSNDSALMRSQATELAYQILDDMRANKNTATTTTAYDVTLNTAPAAPGVLCNSAVCTPAQTAAYDVYAWLTRLAAAMPSGTGSISIAASTTGGISTNTATIVVQWDDSAAQSLQGFGATPFGHQVNTQITLETLL